LINKNKNRIIYSICAVYIIANAIFISKEQFWFMALPLLGFLLYMYFTSLDKILLLITFLTPLSVTLSSYEAQLGLALPTEPMMVSVMFLYIYKVFFDHSFDIKILKHPVTISVLFYLLWLFVTSFTSEIPLVSFKFLIAKLWFIIPFFFLATQLFKNLNNFKIFSWMYMLSLSIVIIYTTYKHSAFSFDEDVGHWIMDPFYNDHTAYGAMIAFFLPVVIGFLFDREYSNVQRLFTFFMLIILATGLYLSYSRAAWLGLIAAIGIFIILKFKIKFKWVALSGIVMLSVFLILRTQIIMKMEKNKQDTSDKLSEHIQSMSNISTDASNLERINRWVSALRMFKERPFFGYGPGTYQFCYAPFQYSYEKTIISTNAGNKGNAHSEYIGPLAETGVFGLFSVLAIAITTLITAYKIYLNTKVKKIRLLSLLAFLSIITYYIHGFLNNFLDTDKASVPFWGFIAMIVALDVYHLKAPELNNEENN